jgi:hypothetical protein
MEGASARRSVAFAISRSDQPLNDRRYELKKTGREMTEKIKTNAATLGTSKEFCDESNNQTHRFSGRGIYSTDAMLHG